MRAIQFSAAMGGNSGGIRQLVGRFARRVVSAVRAMSSSRYRPEKHYMRGTRAKAHEQRPS